MEIHWVEILFTVLVIAVLGWSAYSFKTQKN